MMMGLDQMSMVWKQLTGQEERREIVLFLLLMLQVVGVVLTTPASKEVTLEQFSAQISLLG